jgi:hypothetical protein
MKSRHRASSIEAGRADCIIASTARATVAAVVLLDVGDGSSRRGVWTGDGGLLLLLLNESLSNMLFLRGVALPLSLHILRGLGPALLRGLGLGVWPDVAVLELWPAVLRSGRCLTKLCTYDRSSTWCVAIHSFVYSLHQNTFRRVKNK